MIRQLRPVALSFSLALLAACHGGAAVRERPPMANADAPKLQQAVPNDTYNAVAWMQTSTEYALLTEQTYRALCGMLPEAVADPSWTALAGGEQSDGFESLPPAIIADIDETLLDNSAYAARSIHQNTPFDPVTWLAWIEEEAAPALPGAQTLIDCLAENGVNLIYLSNRKHVGERQPTIDNLRKVGFPLPPGTEDRVLLRGDPRGLGDHASDKDGRRRWVGARYRVLALIGDQLGDFIERGDVAPAARRELAEPYRSWWGQRWFMLANPSYGVWVDVLKIGCDDAKTDPERCRHNALSEH